MTGLQLAAVQLHCQHVWYLARRDAGHGCDAGKQRDADSVQAAAVIKQWELVMLKEVPDDRLGLRLINLISVTLARLFVFYSQHHFCMYCGAAELRGNLLPAGSGPGWMPVHGVLWDSAENLNTLACVCSPLSPWVQEQMLESCL